MLNYTMKIRYKKWVCKDTGDPEVPFATFYENLKYVIFIQKQASSIV